MLEPVEVFHEGRWLSGTMMATRLDPDGWYGLVGYTDPDTRAGYYRWCPKAQLRAVSDEQIAAPSTSAGSVPSPHAAPPVTAPRHVSPPPPARTAATAYGLSVTYQRGWAAISSVTGGLPGDAARVEHTFATGPAHAVEPGTLVATCDSSLPIIDSTMREGWPPVFGEVCPTCLAITAEAP